MNDARPCRNRARQRSPIRGRQRAVTTHPSDLTYRLDLESRSGASFCTVSPAAPPTQARKGLPLAAESMTLAVKISARCENACGKLPI